jgi:hypothetical protein
MSMMIQTFITTCAIGLQPSMYDPEKTPSSVLRIKKNFSNVRTQWIENPQLKKS